MKNEGVQAEVYGRPKHTYSIWRKMAEKFIWRLMNSDARRAYCR